MFLVVSSSPLTNTAEASLTHVQRRSIVTLLVMETATIGVEDLVNPSKVLASVYAGTFAPAIRKPPASDSTLTSARATMEQCESKQFWEENPVPGTILVCTQY
jgi:hypothetical protein